MNDNFEWDKNKNLSNIRKHGVSFPEAETVFLDDRAIVIPDPDHSYNEERFIITGYSAESRILTVCHCERRDGDVTRIISARKATNKEKQQYFGGI